MANIEDSVFDEGLPVNTIAMATRLIEILKANNTNAYVSLPDTDKIRYRMCLWLINQQVFGQTPQIDMYEEWNSLRMQGQIDNQRMKLSQIKGPKSICVCGHTGDGVDSLHADTLIKGHGACKVPGCDCKRFTWDRWTDTVKDYLGVE